MGIRHRKTMLGKALFVCALVAVAVAIDSETMSADIEGTTELLQEHAKVEAKAKEGIQLGEKEGAKDTLTIWGKEVSMQKVQLAKKQLHHVMKHISAKRPQLLSSISTIQELTDHPELLGEGKLNGGYKKLRKVLWKIDQLEQELFDEWEMLRQQYEAAKKRCDDAWNASEDKLNADIERYETMKREVREHRNGIEEDKAHIKASENKEVGVWAARLEDSKEETTAGYDKYWIESDDRAAVRNILMQAVWLVCYGFRKFRHDEFCETLRKEPDFAETGIANGEAKGAKWEGNAKTSYAFSETMEEVWKQQKAADAHAVNREDGDPDMEKGFVNNRAPWGVDPPAEETSLIQEATGVDANDVQADGTMSNQALASRLDFLVQSSSMPEKASAPIMDLIEALQEDDGDDGEREEATSKKEKKLGESGSDDEGETPWWKKQWSKFDKDDKKKKTLVMIMVDIEKEQGTLQHEADLEWMATIKLTRDAQMEDNLGLNQETVIQNDYGESIKNHNAEINSISKVDIALKKSIDDLTTAMHDEMEICQVEWMDIDVQREANEEEQVNIKRLNSLLRFLALGDVPVCEEMSGEDKPCNEERDRGTCTWWTRGMSEGGSGTSDEGDRAFCACEFGFYGENCEKIKCPGIGKVMYKDTDPGVCSNRGGKCDDDYCDDNGCDADKGQCTECMYKYHGYGAKVSKCQFKYCPMAHSSQEGGDASAAEGYLLPTNEEELAKQCSQHGQCDKRSGKCACDADFWGDHCGWKKCPGAVSEGGNSVEAKFAGWSASACHGRGECLTREVDGELEGFCKCNENHNYGKACEWHKCGDGGNGVECQGRGTCKKENGMCMCDAPFHGARCEGGEGSKKQCFSCSYKSCIGDCGDNGSCNKIAGECTCNAQEGTFYNGALCKAPCRMLEYVSDWTRSMDKWGWSTCKEDFLLTGIKRDGAGDALYNLAYGKCARPCEGTASSQKALRLEHCYHENWWKKFDFAGGKFCRKNYFIAGLFRSHCNSLYCLEMAKCCQVQRSLWNQCKWVAISSQFSDKNCKEENGRIECSWAEIEDSKSFVAGFYRTQQHTLDGLTYIRKCEPYFFGASCRPGESGKECKQ